MTLVQIAVAADEEDGGSENTDEHTAPGTFAFGVAYIGRDNGSGLDLDGGWIFRSTGIPQGSTVVWARITVRRGTDFSGTVTGEWDAFDVDSPTDFNAADTHRISDHHTRTLNPQADTFTPVANGSLVSPDLRVPVQAVVNRAGFSGDIGICFRNTLAGADGYQQILDRNTSAANAAVLDVVYGTETALNMLAARA